LQALTKIPGAEMMHQKYSALLAPYLQTYGLQPSSPVPIWNQQAAWGQVLERVQQSISKSRVVDYVHQIYQVVQQLEAGTEVSEETLRPLLTQLDEMKVAVQQLADEYPQLPGQFERGTQHLQNQLDRDLAKGNDFLMQGKSEDALRSYERAYNCFLACQDIQGQGIALFGKAQAHQQQDEHTLAENCYKQARRCFVQISDRVKECTLLYAWGNLCRERSQPQKARNFYYQGINLLQGKANEEQIPEGYKRIGDSWADERRFDKAITYYQKALKIAQKLENVDEEQKIWISQGALYGSLENLEEAIYCYKKALSLTNESTYPEDRVMIELYLSQTYQALAEKEEALGHKQKADKQKQEAQKYFQAGEVLVDKLDPFFQEMFQMGRPDNE